MVFFLVDQYIILIFFFIYKEMVTYADGLPGAFGLNPLQNSNQKSSDPDTLEENKDDPYLCCGDHPDWVQPDHPPAT